MEKLYALSIRQPWLDMIVRGVKTMEIRTWQVRHRGVIALHAPLRIDFRPAHFYGYNNPLTLPRGKIIAIAEISDVVTLDGDSWQKFLEQHRDPLAMASGAYGVILTNVRELQPHVACKGRQLLFELDQDVAERVRRLAGLNQLSLS